jgi:transposase-like protein
MDTLPVTTKYKSHRFPVEIISYAVWLYFRFCLSFRDVEELLLERGVVVTDKAIRTQGLPGKSTIDKSGAYTRAIEHYNRDHHTAILSRHSKYLHKR